MYKIEEQMLKASWLFSFIPINQRSEKNPEMATVKIYAAMTDVASTDFRDTQNVTANQTKLLVSDATSEFARTA